MAPKTFLSGKRIAILVAEGFEQLEMTEPRAALQAAGAQADIISPESVEVIGFHHNDKADTFTIDVPLSQAEAADYDALVLPGGVANPDKLRTIPEAVNFIRDFVAANKPIAAICHGPWTLIEADAVRGRTVTSWPSLHTDLTNAGAQWVDREVVVDGQLVTSRKPQDIPAFNAALLELFSRVPEAAGARR